MNKLFKIQEVTNKYDSAKSRKPFGVPEISPVNGKESYCRHK